MDFKRARAKTRYVVEKSKKQSWQKLVSELTASTPVDIVWNKVKSIFGRGSDQSISHLVSNDKVYCSSEEIAEILADTYEQQFSEANYDPAFQQFKLQQECQGIFFGNEEDPINRTISLTELNQALDRKRNTSPGVDNFLKHRTFRVRVNGVLTNAKPRRNGTPEGSVLSPTLFLIAINSISEDIKAPLQMRLFADDVVLYMKSKNLNMIQTTMQT